jgi:hypothetical protein
VITIAWNAHTIVRPEATPDAEHQTRAAHSLCRRAVIGHLKAEHRMGHNYPRHSRRRRLQLPPPHPVAQAIAVPNPAPNYRATSARPRLRSTFFTDDDRTSHVPTIALRAWSGHRPRRSSGRRWHMCCLRDWERSRLRDPPPFGDHSRAPHDPCLRFEPHVTATLARFGPGAPATALEGWRRMRRANERSLCLVLALAPDSDLSDVQAANAIGSGRRRLTVGSPPGPFAV